MGAGRDESPAGTYQASALPDQVVLQGPQGEQRLAVPGLSLQAVAVGDGGQVAVAGTRPQRPHSPVLAVLTGGMPREIGELGYRASFDVAPDGRVAFHSVYDIYVDEGQGPRPLARVPTMVDQVEYLDDGRLVARTVMYSWGTAIPVYYVVEPDGRATPLEDPRLADELGLPVLDPLARNYQEIFPGVGPYQAVQLAEQFGYSLPSMVLRAPDRRRAVFSCDERVSPRAGTWVLQVGSGRALPLQARPGSPPLPARRLSEGVWSPDGSQAALLFSENGQEPNLAVLGADNLALVAPFPVNRHQDEAPACWSQDGRLLAVELLENGRPVVYCCDGQRFFPVIPEARLRGWDGEKLKVEKDGVALSIPPAPLDPARAAEYLLGPAPPPAGTIEVGDGYVDVGPVRLPRR
jgi:hypothetical protein